MQKEVAFRAEILNWTGLIGHGESEENALKALRAMFEANQKENNKLPRPGDKVPLRFAEAENMEKHRQLAEEFFPKVLDLDFGQGFFSDETYLVYFEGFDGYHERTKEDIISRIKHSYHVDISLVYDQPLPDVLAFIENNKS